MSGVINNKVCFDSFNTILFDFLLLFLIRYDSRCGHQSSVFFLYLNFLFSNACHCVTSITVFFQFPPAHNNTTQYMSMTKPNPS